MRDDVLSCDIQRVWDENFGVYGARIVWRQLLREGNVTVERLMGIWGLSGAILGKRYCVTTQPDESMERPKDLVQRNFTDEARIVSGSPILRLCRHGTDLPMPRLHRRLLTKIVGWSVSRSLKSGLALDALEQAICEREVTEDLVHHSDRGVQYLSVRYTDRLVAAGIASSVASVGDSCDKTR